MINVVYIFTILGFYYCANHSSLKINLTWAPLLALSLYFTWLLPVPVFILSVFGLHFLLRQKHWAWRLFTAICLVWFMFDLILIIDGYFFHRL